MRRRGPTARRWLAAGLAAAGTATALQVLAPDPPAGRPLVVAARSVPAGAALQAGDLTVATRPASDVPVGAVRTGEDLTGRVVAAPLAPGEVLTSARLVSPGLLAGRPRSEVVAPVRIADPEAAALLGAGTRVDVLLAVEGARTARTVARGATVLARPAPASGGPGLPDLGADIASGGLVLLAVEASVAAALAQAASEGPLSVVLR